VPAPIELPVVQVQQRPLGEVPNRREVAAGRVHRDVPFLERLGGEAAVRLKPVRFRDPLPGEI